LLGSNISGVVVVMTQDQIIFMARASGWMSEYESSTGFSAECAIKFAKLVAQHERKRMAWTQGHWTEYEHNIASAEREACAKIVEETFYSVQAVDAIRARGKK
jgi:hypothetical protein